jgi:hypothetical protein
MSFQAVVRDSDDELITSTQVGMRISILQGSETGTAVYEEIQNPYTNTNGLISIEIGGLAGWEEIDWGAGPYFLKTETDPLGGNDYTIEGSSQLLSVPYAYYSETASQLTQTGVNGDQHYIGDLYGGGIVFYVYDQGQKGLIASLDDLDGGSGTAWSNVSGTEIGIGARSFYSGPSNTSAITGQSGHTSSAAQLCADYSNEGYSDWYLPAAWELDLLYHSAYVISRTLGEDANIHTNGFDPAFEAPTFGSYWSSTEHDGSNAKYYSFNSGALGSGSKTEAFRVRAVRAYGLDSDPGSSCHISGTISDYSASDTYSGYTYYLYIDTDTDATNSNHVKVFTGIWTGTQIQYQFDISDVTPGTYYLHMMMETPDHGQIFSVGYYGGDPMPWDPPAAPNADVDCGAVFNFQVYD